MKYPTTSIRISLTAVGCLVSVHAIALAPPIILRPDNAVTVVPPDWTAQIQLRDGKVPFLFGQATAEPPGQDAQQPIIIAFVEGVWKYVKLPDAGNWVGAYQSEDSKHVWAVTEHCPEGCDWHLVVYISHDGGREWRQQKIRKPHYHMHLHAFRMDAEGKGELSFYSEDDVDGSVFGFPRGVYTCSTKNWGDSWSVAKFKPDILVHAETADQVYPFDGVADANQIKDIMETTKQKSTQRTSNDPGYIETKP
ncbi:MAG: hypothetical protein IT366_13900 [Candidatus Hydrogenedentes bacterium]|nr:hypothetical protein [Candidatus Hydrogenedentota bacterium]